MRFKQLAFLIIAACTTLSGIGHAQPIVEALTNGTPLLDVRLRYDQVDQSNKPKDAQATTVRARAGYRTASLFGFTALAEVDVVQHFGAEQFNDSINGRAAYPIIADPDLVALNRLQLDYGAHIASADGAAPDLHIIAGRQEIMLGNQRFIGNAGWRQHEQTFDAVSLIDTSLPGTTLFYAYVNRVNRVFGQHSPAGHFDSATHLLNAVYTGLPHLRLEGYGYFYDFRNAPALSTANYGVRADYSFDLGSGVGATIGGEYARQTNRANNPLHVDLADYRAEAGLNYAGLAGTIGYEVSEGNGVAGFQTPLVSGHLYQGWAELFIAKPPQGLKDFYLKANYAFAAPLGIRILPSLAWHDFSAEHIDADYGSEWDLGVEAQFDTHLAFDIAYADFSGAGPLPDKRELWLYATYRL